jgi:hypothetical protein
VTSSGSGAAQQQAQQAVTRARQILAQLDELEPRLAASSSGEVEMTLLEHATELVDEAGRLLEQLGRVTT